MEAEATHGLDRAGLGAMTPRLLQITNTKLSRKLERRGSSPPPLESDAN